MLSVSDKLVVVKRHMRALSILNRHYLGHERVQPHVLAIFFILRSDSSLRSFSIDGYYLYRSRFHIYLFQLSYLQDLSDISSYFSRLLCFFDECFPVLSCSNGAAGAPQRAI